MSSRILATSVLLLLTACPNIASAQVRSIEGTYRNPALGYSIQIPRGLKGVTGDQDGPERGLRISLASGGDIVVFGEPHSLEYKTPEDGLKDELELRLRTAEDQAGYRRQRQRCEWQARLRRSRLKFILGISTRRRAHLLVPT
jgi:hypothetical protein